MARINLLPWREELREQRQREFLVTLFGVVFIAGGVAFSVNEFFKQKVAEQDDLNKTLEQAIAILDDQIEEIKDLKERRKSLIDRMKVIKDLQGNRPVIVRLFDEMVRKVPEGVYFDSMERKGKALEIKGTAESSNQISSLMRSLDESEWFENTALIGTKRNGNFGPDTQAQDFEVTVAERIPNAENPEGDESDLALEDG